MSDKELTGNPVTDMLLPILKGYKEEKEKEGYIATVEMLIEELEGQYEKHI
jgi:hypothetical protein